MTRATRQLTVAIPLVLLYLLMLLGVLPAPVVSEQTASAILPVVSDTFPRSYYYVGGICS